MEVVVARKLARSINNDRLDEIQALLKRLSLQQRRSIVSKKKKKNKSLLLVAVESNRPKLVKYLIGKCGVSAKEAGPCVCAAASNKSLEIVKLLVKNGSDVNELNSQRFSALYFACIKGEMAIVEYLLKHGAEVNIDDNLERHTLLMVSLKYPKICKRLLINGADPQRVNAHGRTALMMAVESEGFHQSVKVLLKYKADMNFTNNYGEDAVFLACQKGFMDMVEVLQSHGAHTTKSLARSYQMQSCLAAMNNNWYQTESSWRMYTQILGLPSTTPLLHTDRPITEKSCFEPILNLFDDNWQKVFLYLENHFNLYTPYTLEALSLGLWFLSDIEDGLKVFSFFLEILASCSDDLFFETVPYISKLYLRLEIMLMMYNAYEDLEGGGSELLQIYCNHCEEIVARLKRMDNIKRDLFSEIIDSVFYTINSLLSSLLRIIRGKMPVLKEIIEKLLSVDLRGSDNNTLLHYCIKSAYSENIYMALLSCKADVNVRNRQHFTPVHFILDNVQRQRMEVIESFLSHGFLFDAANDKEFCLSCTLRKREILPQPVKNTTLKCLAANVVGKNVELYKYEVSRDLEDFISLHT